jgi:hypothetical protein
MHSLNSGNKYPKSLGYYFYFHRNLPKENNRPMGENSPNLVTLLQTKAATRFIRVTFTSISCRTDKVTPDVKKILPPPPNLQPVVKAVTRAGICFSQSLHLFNSNHVINDTK